ncbi:MAG: hypothetical protein IKX56_03385 [Muribaculaceae bacterium]|nr:hypothetical protein [Muribaculaceae bacterium]
MAKRIIALLVTTLALYATAQNAVGDWYIHTSYVGNDIIEVVEGQHWVYYLTGTDLFRLDKDTQENEALSRVNDLSDMVISQIHYNSDKDYLVIIYSNSNIDIIKSDGTVVNMPEIKNAVMTSSKAINDVTFASGLIYVATNFGYVVIDDSKFVVKESHLYGEALTSVAQVGKMLLLSAKKHLYYGSANEYHELLSSFTVATPSSMSNCALFPISENSFFCVTDSTHRVTMTVNDAGHAAFNLQNIIDTKATVIQKTKGGYLLNVPKKRSYKTDEHGHNLSILKEAGNEMCSAHPDGDSTIWAAGNNGLHKAGSENYYKPNVLSFANPYWMTYNKQSDLLYISSTNFSNKAIPTGINTYDGIKWSDVTPEGAPRSGIFWIEFMPDDPRTYFISTWQNGLLKVEDNQIALTYNSENSPMVNQYSPGYVVMHPITSIDRNGNLWLIQSYKKDAPPIEHTVMVLPADKTKLNQVTASDWITPSINVGNSTDEQQARFLSTKNSNYDIKIYTDGNQMTPLYMWNSNGEIQPSKPLSFSSLTDQDGEIVSWTNIKCLTEDLNGNVWMGFTEGICVFNPALAFKEGSAFYITRPKIPRNDGTGYADRLMDGIQVNCVAVDGANRKWIGTNSSGLFLVSANGDQIIKKFNTTNSPLASNIIYQVCCNPNSNSVYVTTPAGLYEYFSDSSPAEPTYDNIYAYPNPVRPDYYGEVTIMGLMDNSLVKIADASGNVICQLKSTGGMATWDCCDQHGNSVKSGVYFVLCSQANGSGEAVVSKIAVIR